MKSEILIKEFEFLIYVFWVWWRWGWRRL